MKNNWLITQTVVGLVVSSLPSLCVHGAELPGPVPDPFGDELGYPTNELIALELGRADATRDVNHGVLRIPIYGSPIEWSSEFSRILEEKYKIDRYGLGGPLITPGLTEYARGYGEISERAIHDKFGSNFFERVQQEARRAYDQRMLTEKAITPAPADTPAAAVPTTITSPAAVTGPIPQTSEPAAPVVAATPVAKIPAITREVTSAVTETPPPTTHAAVASVVAPAAVAPAVTPATRSYRVKPGDTFWEIARQHRVPVASLVAANPGVNPSKLPINYNLNVPVATRP